MRTVLHIVNIRNLIFPDEAMRSVLYSLQLLSNRNFVIPSLHGMQRSAKQGKSWRWGRPTGETLIVESNLRARDTRCTAFL